MILIRDPDRLVVDLELEADGKRIRDHGVTYGQAEWRRSMILPSTVPANAQLVVRLAVPAAIKSHPFRLEKIPLP